MGKGWQCFIQACECLLCERDDSVFIQACECLLCERDDSVLIVGLHVTMYVI